MKKTCKSCNKTFSIEMFNKSGNGYRRGSCKSCVKEQRKKSDGKPLSRYKKYKRDAKRRGLEFSLTKTQFYSYEGDDCHYCGGEVNHISLDRIDNDYGYIEGNVTSCCHMCNSFKHVFEEQDFINHVGKIFSYQNKKANHGKQEITSEEALKEDSS